jgi:eukaryotic-like serine/threonine-protein kinase
LGIACQMLGALQHAHEAGVVHRDVKPGNVIVARREHVKVTDFGIARAAGASRLTATGLIIGSARYISPEHVRGERETPHSDIYSAGIVLYEMLTGSPPFEGESLLEVAERHITDDVPAPSLVNPRVPATVDEAVLRATAKSPGERWSCAEDMAAALARWRAGPFEPGEARYSRRVTRRLRRAGVDTPELPRLSL